MVTTVKKIFASAALGAALVLVGAPTVLAVTTPKQSACEGAGGAFTVTDPATGAGTCDNKSGGGLNLQDSFKTVANTLIFLVGAISVIMVIIGGLRYVLSGGDSAGVKSAKDTILYAVIGVVVSLLAYAIVNFVLNRFGT